MTTLVLVLLSFAGYLVAYHTYGRWLGRKIFGLDPTRLTPAHTCRDGVDYVPTRKSVLFGHHFTSIAGTGPIVGPAIAVFWGWLPALLWVVFGCIFVGAVHDFGSLVVSLRSRGQSIGDVAGQVISTRARLLFLCIMFFVLMIVIGIFGLVIAVIFAIYPQTVLSVWMSMPLAVLAGFWMYKRKGAPLLPALVALVILYGCVYLGVKYLPIDLGLPLFSENYIAEVVVWTLVLLVYCFIASVLPVWVLLQPRDFINSQQLFVTLALLMLGLLVARPELAAPAFNSDVAGAPPMFPFLFITIACGAVSGFHCLVSSGTSSKQLNRETDALYVGYGGMLFEGVLAILVIVACCAGLGMRHPNGLEGTAAWHHYYGGSWGQMGLVEKLAAFIDGAANMIQVLGIPLDLAAGIIAVMVACFAATTLDTATRLQRYVIQELGTSLHLPGLTNKYIATGIAVGTGGMLALLDGPKGPGSGGLLLWPLFGAVNQLLAGLAFLVLVFYLLRGRRPFWFLLAPLALMTLIPTWGMCYNIFTQWIPAKHGLLVFLGGIVVLLQVWLIIEGGIVWYKIKKDGTVHLSMPSLPEEGEAVQD